MQVVVDAGQLEVIGAAGEAEAAGRLVHLGGLGKPFLSEIDVAELVMVLGALRVELDRLFEVLPCLVELFLLIVSLGQQVIQRVVVLVLEQRLEHGDHAVGLLLRREQLGQLDAGLDVIGVGFQDLFQHGGSLVGLVRLAIGLGQQQLVAGLRGVGGDRGGELFDGGFVVALEEELAAGVEKRLGLFGFVIGRGCCRRRFGGRFIVGVRAQ